ncbi:MAG: DUF938 domain-containing protein [Hyphomicrobiales bacterium]|nr:DUF938 domain-containing protein [Hyphomicrobiales bacterium]MCP5373183.1 DUF938 domain-containing protein [Hyphomicrobiales bacterium]
MTSVKLHAEATRRNRDPILAVLRRVLPARGLVLEIAAGTGQHAAYFAPLFPDLAWQPTDADAAALPSIAAWAAEAAAPNLRPPRVLDVCAADWGVDRADAVYCCNMIHISPWRCTRGLMAGAGRVLAPGGVLVTYGPYKLDGRHTAPSNAAFDRALRAQDPDWGVRDLEHVAAEAAAHGLVHEQTVAMPNNNQTLIFRKPQ